VRLKVEPESSDTNAGNSATVEAQKASKFSLTQVQPLTKQQLSNLATWFFRVLAVLLAFYLLTQPGLLWLGTFVFGCGFAAVGIGVFLTFRILNFPDLTIEGSYALGTTVSAALITTQKDNFLGDPWIATLIAMLCGAIAGTLTGLLHTRLKINGLLASILVATALYSINIRILGGQAYIALTDVPTVIDKAINFARTFLGLEKLDRLTEEWLRLGFFAMVALVIVLVLNWFLNTQLGLALRATGDNEAMIKALGFNTNNGKVLVLAISNGLFGLTGALVTSQYMRSGDASAGSGLIVAGLAAVIIGESFMPPRNVLAALLGAWIGSVIYRVIYTSVYGLELTWDIFTRVSLTFVVIALVSYLIFLTMNSQTPAWITLLSILLGAIVAALLSSLIHFMITFSLKLDLTTNIILKGDSRDVKLVLAVLIIFAMGIPALRSRIGIKALKADLGK
jgi:putative ABC transport system permease protein